MKAFIASIIALVVIAVAAGFILDSRNQSAETTYTTESARPK